MSYRDLILLTILCTGVNQLLSGELTGPEIIQEVNNRINPESSYAKSKMTVVTRNGKKRIFIYDSWSKNFGEKNLIRYIEPRRIFGQATLMLNHADDIWMYFSRTKRIRKLATHAKKQKMEGSDFSYADMGSGNSFIDDFTSILIREEKKEDAVCHVLELKRKENTDISYSRMILFVRQDNFVPIYIEYYDEQNPTRLLKTLIQSDIRDVDGIPTAFSMVMKNHLDNTETVMEFLDIQYNPEIDDDLFTERGLRK